MRKKLLVSVLMLTMVMGALFARGQQDPAYCYTRQDGETARAEFLQFLAGTPKTTLTGEIYLENRLFPELHSAGQVYQLVTIPMRFPFRTGIAEGTTVTLETTPVTDTMLENYAPFGLHSPRHNYRYGTDTDGEPDLPDNMLLVTKWTIGEETYNLADAITNAGPPEWAGKGRRGHGGFMGRGEMPFNR